MTKSGGEIAQGKAKDAGGLTPAKDDNAALRDCYSRTFAGNSDDCYKIPNAWDLAESKIALSRLLQN